MVIWSAGAGALKRDDKQTQRENESLRPMKPADSRPPAESLRGVVERVLFHTEETGFCILRVVRKRHPRAL